MVHERHKAILRNKFGAQKAEIIIRKIEAFEDADKLKKDNEIIQDKIQRRALLQKAIPKKDLIDGMTYEGECERLEHNTEGKWNETGGYFIIRKYEFEWTDFNIDHIEDVIESRFAGFAPFKLKE